MLCQQRHRHRAIHDPLRNHQRGQPLAKRVVVPARVPDRNLVRLPGFDRADADRLRRHQRHVTAARSARVLRDGQGVQINDACRELAVLGR